MSEMKPIKRKGSMLEKADARFNFGNQLRRLDPETLGDGPVLEARPAKRTPAPKNAPKAVRNAVPVHHGYDAPLDAATSSVRQEEPAPPRSPVAVAISPAPDQAMGANPIAVANARSPLSRRRFQPRAPQQNIDPAALALMGMVEGSEANSALAEEYRIIKRQLLRTAGGSAAGRRILITSAQPAEGKTFSSVNLALSLATEHDLSVLLIDADFARREVTTRLGIVSGPGLLDVLGDPKLDLADCVIPTDVAGLSVLPAGTSTSRDTELLNSARMLELLNTLEADAPDRIIIFDSMPLLAASSAGVVAQLCGQVVVVVRADVTREAALRDAIGLIGQHHGISLLLNRVRFTPEGRRFGSYYGEGG